MIQSEEMCFGSCGIDCDFRCSLYGKSRYVLTCDKCKNNSDLLWQVGKKQLCEDCLLDMFNTVDGVCNECYTETTLYNVDDTYLCADCLEEYFERITEDE